MKYRTISISIMIIVAIAVSLPVSMRAQSTYPIVDTNQDLCYDNQRSISCPTEGEQFYGQDSQHEGLAPAYRDNGDGTVSDLSTGLMWQKNLLDVKPDYATAQAMADTFSLAGYDDWRLPTIKELYSLMDFTGVTGMSAQSSVPYIDTEYFDFRFGGTVIPSERFIDAQYASDTPYKGFVFENQPALFGLNLADGRIKGYPQTKAFEVRFVRGNPQYGINDFVDNGDGTITDNATTLMWDKDGSSEGMNWEDALAWVQTRNAEQYKGYTDWRLPNAKELQSLLDYDRSPSETNSAAISPLFQVPTITDEGGETNYPFYWTSTTHEDGPTDEKAVYICFGEALGFMEAPPGSGNYRLMDVHGAGAQRSDPKDGNPADYPNGFGPQGDVIRIFNFVRPVRDAEATTGIDVGQSANPEGFRVQAIYPNPASSMAIVPIELETNRVVTITLYSITGEQMAEVTDAGLTQGSHLLRFDTSGYEAGTYFCAVRSSGAMHVQQFRVLPQ
ncbi:MAG: hypothetical protein CL946_10770 [Ectothiorhodospiraceae bacterium]|nr:hypothetical protein [Ectothiorhodospiraceae bacterium]